MFKWVLLTCAGKQTVSDYRRALLRALIGNFQHGSVKACPITASKLIVTQGGAKENLLL